MEKLIAAWNRRTSTAARAEGRREGIEAAAKLVDGFIKHECADDPTLILPASHERILGARIAARGLALGIRALADAQEGAV